MTKAGTDTASQRRRAIREGIFTGSLADVGRVRLAGTRCTRCHEVALGTVLPCPNCGSGDVAVVALTSTGKVWTYTVVRHRPPGDYRGPEPFVPFGMGLVELPDGLRVLAPLECPIDEIRIGTTVSFKPYVRRDADGSEVVAFTYENIEAR